MRVPRPKTRGDCDGVPRPCPFYGCRYHLGLDVTPTGHIYFREVQDGEASCALDVAEVGGVTLEEVGDLFHLTKERIRQIEVNALLAVKMNFGDRARVEEGEAPLTTPSDAVYKVDCPTCHAKPDRPCTGLRGGPRDMPHVLRERASRGDA